MAVVEFEALDCTATAHRRCFFQVAGFCHIVSVARRRGCTDVFIKAVNHSVENPRDRSANPSARTYLPKAQSLLAAGRSKACCPSPSGVLSLISRSPSVNQTLCYFRACRPFDASWNRSDWNRDLVGSGKLDRVSTSIAAVRARRQNQKHECVARRTENTTECLRMFAGQSSKKGLAPTRLERSPYANFSRVSKRSGRVTASCGTLAVATCESVPRATPFPNRRD